MFPFLTIDFGKLATVMLTTMGQIKRSTYTSGDTLSHEKSISSPSKFCANLKSHQSAKRFIGNECYRRSEPDFGQNLTLGRT